MVSLSRGGLVMWMVGGLEKGLGGGLMGGPARVVL